VILAVGRSIPIAGDWLAEPSGKAPSAEAPPRHVYLRYRRAGSVALIAMKSDPFMARSRRWELASRCAGDGWVLRKRFAVGAGLAALRCRIPEAGACRRGGRGTAGK